MCNIFDLESLYRIQREAPKIGHHRFCSHSEGLCLQDSTTAWVQPHLSPSWIMLFQQNLFISMEGKSLWAELMDKKFDAGEVIETIALGVGEGRRDREAKQSRSQAVKLKQFLRKTRESLGKIKQKLVTVQAGRKGPVFVPSADWPNEMVEFEDSLSNLAEKAQWLVEHYKSMAHASRRLDTNEAFMVSVDNLRNSCNLGDNQIATLLSAGYAVSGKQPIGPQELRERMKSARKLFGTRVSE